MTEHTVESDAGRMTDRSTCVCCDETFDAGGARRSDDAALCPCGNDRGRFIPAVERCVGCIKDAFDGLALLADGWVGFDDSRHYRDAVLRLLPTSVLPPARTEESA